MNYYSFASLFKYKASLQLLEYGLGARAAHFAILATTNALRRLEFLHIPREVIRPKGIYYETCFRSELFAASISLSRIFNIRLF